MILTILAWIPLVILIGGLIFLLLWLAFQILADITRNGSDLSFVWIFLAVAFFFAWVHWAVAYLGKTRTPAPQPTAEQETK